MLKQVQNREQSVRESLQKIIGIRKKSGFACGDRMSDFAANAKTDPCLLNFRLW